MSIVLGRTNKKPELQLNYLEEGKVNLGQSPSHYIIDYIIYVIDSWAEIIYYFQWSIQFNYLLSSKGRSVFTWC